MTPYDDVEANDNSLRVETSRHHGDLIALWLIAIKLASDAFAPGQSYRSPENADAAERKAYRLRLQLLGLSTRGAKPALDLLLAGYYTEAFGLIRTMLDGWCRSLYVRLRPTEYGRWYSPEQANIDPLQVVRKAEPNLGEIDGVITADGDADDRRFFEEANLRFRLLSAGTHPSGEGITQVVDNGSQVLLFNPFYRENLCRHGFNHGLFALLILLDEVDCIGEQSQGWKELLGEYYRLWKPVHASIQPVLQEEKTRLAAERAAKQAARRSKPMQS